MKQLLDTPRVVDSASPVAARHGEMNIATAALLDTSGWVTSLLGCFRSRVQVTHFQTEKATSAELLSFSINGPT